MAQPSNTTPRRRATDPLVAAIKAIRDHLRQRDRVDAALAQLRQPQPTPAGAASPRTGTAFAARHLPAPPPNALSTSADGASWAFLAAAVILALVVVGGTAYVLGKRDATQNPAAASATTGSVDPRTAMAGRAYEKLGPVPDGARLFEHQVNPTVHGDAATAQRKAVARPPTGYHGCEVDSQVVDSASREVHTRWKNCVPDLRT